MTRFEQELSGALGTFWKNRAERELKNIAYDLENGLITIDESGVARNCAGRALMNDMLEKVLHVSSLVDEGATKEARKAEVEASLAVHRRNARSAGEEELSEMRAAFGKGQTVVNLLTGEKNAL